MTTVIQVIVILNQKKRYYTPVYFYCKLIIIIIIITILISDIDGDGDGSHGLDQDRDRDSGGDQDFCSRGYSNSDNRGVVHVYSQWE